MADNYISGTRGSVCDSHYHFSRRFRISKIHQLAQIFSENSGFFKKCFDFQELSRISCNPGKIPWNFRLKSMWFGAIFNQICKILEKSQKICKICENLWKIEIGTVQRNVNLVDLEKCWKMAIYLQRSVPIQPRTSLLKFEDHRFCRSQFRSHAESLVAVSRVNRFPLKFNTILTST